MLHRQHASSVAYPIREPHEYTVATNFPYSHRPRSFGVVVFRPAGPYLYHYVVEAMLHCGLNDEARDLLYSYWGDIAERGAKTFWEVFGPQNPLLSPYKTT